MTEDERQLSSGAIWQAGMERLVFTLNKRVREIEEGNKVRETLLAAVQGMSEYLSLRDYETRCRMLASQLEKTVAELREVMVKIEKAGEKVVAPPSDHY